MIGRRIKEVREENNLTQKDFGASLGLKPLQIIRYEKGEQVPSAKVLEQISLKFNITIDWLITGRGDKYCNPEEAKGPEGQYLQMYRDLNGEDQELARRFVEFLYNKSFKEKEGE